MKCDFVKFFSNTEETAAISHINVHNMPRDQLVVQTWDAEDLAEQQANSENLFKPDDLFFQIKPDPSGGLALPLPLNAPIDDKLNRVDAPPLPPVDNAPPLPFLPGNFLARGGSPAEGRSRRPSTKSTREFLELRSSNSKTSKEPLNIPTLPDLINETSRRRRKRSSYTPAEDSIRNKDAKFVR